MKKKRMIIAGVVVLLIAATFGIWSLSRSSEPVLSAQTEPLSKTTLKRTVSSSGTVESTSVEQVSNMSNIPIWDVDVAVGSFVNKGDRLCRLYSEETDHWERVEAPVDGTITEVLAINGAPANGVLFTIENTNSLKVTTRFKESDIGSVTTGMPVVIKTDATGDREYLGTLQSIAPAAIKSGGTTGQQQVTSNTTTPEFEATVSIDSPIDGLLIGMKASLETVIEEKPEVFSVPYDALTKNSNGETCILTLSDEAEGVYTVKEIKVDTGIETDFMVEILSSELTEGMPVITNGSELKAGDHVMMDTQQGATDEQQ